MVGVRLVGAFAVSRDGADLDRADLGSRKSRELLKLLAVERAGIVSVDRIVDVIWPGSPPQQPAASVATLVSRLRRSLGPSIVEGDRSGYRLGVPPEVLVDLDEAARWIGEAERRLAAAEPGLGVAAASRAGDLLSAGGVLVDEPAAEWAERARAEYADLVRRCRHVLADAALATGDSAVAAQAAAAAVSVDPYDERSRRALMRAHAAAGEPARALATYAELRELLVTELGADPAEETQALHRAALSDEPLPHPRAATSAPPLPASDPIGLVGRSDELRRLRDSWNAAANGTPDLLLVVGEAGIGKTRLVDELMGIAASTGGTVLAARCYATERSLFLQPIVEAMTTALLHLPPVRIVGLAGEHAAAVSQLLPATAAVLGPPPTRRDGADVERRRAFEAVTAVVRGLAEDAPLLLVLDDLQNAGRSTVELLHYVARHTPSSRLLVVGTVRVEEGLGVLDPLADVVDRLELGPLSPGAVASLAAAAGRGEQSGDIMRRTRGHTLFVVETLRSFVAGTRGIPESLEAAVLARVRRAGDRVEELLRAAAVLGVSFDPATVAGLLGQPLPHVIATCADALAARLLVVADRDYEFANDLVRDVLYATTPDPAKDSYHRLAADLLTDRPEAVALHASAAQDWPRAARAWLHAGETALARAAAADAIELLTSALECADRVDDLEIRARALVARARAKAAGTEYTSALVDIEAAVVAAHDAGDKRLEAVALRELGGEVPTALGLPVADCVANVERGLVLVTSLSDRAMEAELQAWLAVLAANGLRFADAVEHGRLAVAAARASGNEEALAVALDGQKTSLAYLGEVDELAVVLDELDPVLRRRGDLFRLHWAIFESAFIAVAAGDWPAAQTRIEAALEANRRGGFSAYVAWHLAHLGWLARLTGDYDRALDLGQHAVARADEAPHQWSAVVAGAQLGTTLFEVGRTGEAIVVLETACSAAQQEGADAYLLRALSPLAEATGSRALLEQSDALLRSITAPAGSAFLAGDACYLSVARSWLAQDDPQRARDVLKPLLAAATRVPWLPAVAAGSLIDGQAAMLLGHVAEAEELLRRAADLADRHGLPRVLRDATAALESLAGL